MMSPFDIGVKVRVKAFDITGVIEGIYTDANGIRYRVAWKKPDGSID
jgi:hypothetical protein